MKLNQKGFGLLAWLSIIAISGLVIFGGYYVWSENRGVDIVSESNKGSNSRTVGSLDNGEDESIPQKNLNEYSNADFGFTFQYPGTWTLEEKSDEFGEEYGSTISVDMKSENGNKMYFRTDFGGRGGACFPDKNDTPHSLDSECNTSEFLETEMLNLRVPADPEKNDANQITNLDTFSDIYRVNRKFTKRGSSVIAGETLYQICLYTDYFGEVITNAPRMGFELGVLPIPITDYVVSEKDDNNEVFFYLYACMDSNSEDIFESEDGLAAMEIFRSVEFSSPIPQ